MIEDRVKDIIKDRYGSLKVFAEKINVPYTTIDTIFKRGFCKANVVNVIAICRELNIDVDELIDNHVIISNDLRIFRNVNMNGNSLDAIIMDESKKLSVDDKKMIIDIIKNINNRNKGSE